MIMFQVASLESLLQSFVLFATSVMTYDTVTTSQEIWITRDILHLLLVNPRLVADAVAPVAVLVPVAVIVDQTLQIVVVVVVVSILWRRVTR